MQLTIKPPVAFSEMGQRNYNEDYIYPLIGTATTSSKLFIVCDGVGGASKGAIASKLTCEILASFITSTIVIDTNLTYINAAVTAAQELLDEYVQTYDEGNDMATTITLLHIHNQGITIAHIGDSRIYQIRNGKILHKTEDHTLVNEWVKKGIITADQALIHPKRNILHRALQASLYEFVQADSKKLTDLQPNDYFLLCTDGVLECLTDDILCAILAQPCTDVEKMQHIKEHAQLGTDNFSAYLISIDSIR